MSKKIYFSTIHQIIKTGHWITDSVSSELKPFDISEPQYNVLRTLNSQQHQPLTVEQIGKQMIQRSSNVTRIIDKLLGKGLVSRKECPSNRRKMDIMITPEGRNFLRELDVKLAQWHSPLLNKLTDEELQTLTRLIRKLRK
ncbi:MAG: MarR family transcriptional regulator [Roseivirga sp.]|nr:MarR family transcriptional regulator [Roseivirga sp.]